MKKNIGKYNRNTNIKCNMKMNESKNYLKYNRIDESGINRILTHGEKGFIVISANRSEIGSENPNCDLTNLFERWCGVYRKNPADANVQEQWLYRRNRIADRRLKQIIKNSKFPYSPVYGGYHGSDNVEDSYEPSYIVYAEDRVNNANVSPVSWDELFEFAKKMCAMFKQESVYVQAPNEAPIYIDKDGNKVNDRESKNFKINREKEMFFTTADRDKKGKQRFTADIVFENMYHNGAPYCYSNRLRRTQEGEIFLKG